MCADRSSQPIVHLVGSIPLPDAETVFRTLSSAVGQHLVRIPDGETGIRRTWIRPVARTSRGRTEGARSSAPAGSSAPVAGGVAIRAGEPGRRLR